PGFPVNTENHDASVGISPDGQKILIYRSSINMGDIYVCELSGNIWSEPKPLSSPVNSSYQESSACFSSDGNEIFVVSNRIENNLGGKDIFICQKNEKGNWGKARNLSNLVNTNYDEEGVYMHPDNKTLYFSSKGHNSMGGFDIFRTVRDSAGNWSLPENIGYPINTLDDDVFFVMAANGEHGYFSSYKAAGFGEQDIYKVTFLKDIISDTTALQENIAEPQVTIVKGTVIDTKTGQPVEAAIEIVDNKQSELISTVKSNAATGKYLVALPSGKDYGVTTEAEGYLFHSENYNLSDSSSYKEVDKNIDVKKIEPGANEVLNNIFFDYFSAKLKPNSYTELKRLIKILEKYPEMKMEIAGYTDNIGPEDGNIRLSKTRALTVADYLQKNGIKMERLIIKGYGSSKPTADNSTLQGQQKNRRVEFKIIGM
ncbi:MAG: OmpA family protein, partial [Bacteroidia bacterium]|nr:OmpA family protein [Bacteroidia bacterium]